MKDSELRSAVTRFLQQQEKDLDETINSLDSARETIDKAIKAIGRLQRSLMTPSSTEEEEDSVPIISSASIEPVQKSKTEAAPPLVLNGFEAELTNSYNEEPNKFRKAFSANEFGTENVSEIFQTGGEPKFVRKEGGIYYLVEKQGSGYVVPDPASRLNEGYIKSEGLAHLFDIEDYDLDQQPPVTLEKPALVKESSGHWKVSSKGKIRGRS